MKINQHYVWKYYLKPWADSNNQISCSTSEKQFTTNIDNIACERFFYKLTKPKPGDFEYMKQLFNVDGYDTNKKMYFHIFFDTFTKVFNLQEKFIIDFQITSEEEKIFDRAIKELDEEYNSIIENIGFPIINALRSDSELLVVDELKSSFYLYICTQYMRTKRMREQIFDSPNLDSEIRDFLSRTWSIVKHLFALNLADTLFTDEYNIVFLKTNTNHFITGDQPVINTFSSDFTYRKVDSLEIYYPLSPQLSILITKDKEYKNHEVVILSEASVLHYNALIKSAAFAQVYGEKLLI